MKMSREALFLHLRNAHGADNVELMMTLIGYTTWTLREIHVKEHNDYPEQFEHEHTEEELSGQPRAV